MKWDDILKFSKQVPIIQAKMLLVFEKNENILRVNIARLVKAGKLIKLKRGYYVLAQEYQSKGYNKEFLSTNIYYPSYISLEYALSYYQMIPEKVYTITLLTTKRPLNLETKIGNFTYHHIHKSHFWGFRNIVTPEKESSFFIAEPEKAILDIFYFKSGEITLPYLEEMRFQNCENLNFFKLKKYADSFNSAKIIRGSNLFNEFIKKEGIITRIV